MRLTFLGTGTSTGVPVIGCDCAVCMSSDPRDARLRASVLLEIEGSTILVDTSPDLRAQMLQTGTRRIDAVLFTHRHADHTAGLDELRAFNIAQQRRLPVWATSVTAADLQQRFAYAFDHSFSYFGGKPDLDLHPIDESRPFVVGDITVYPIPVFHGRMPIIGFRIGSLAYVTDVKTIPDASVELLQDLDVLVLTALRQDEHGAHLSLSEALVWVDRLSPRRAVLTHLGHEMGLMEDVGPLLPAGVEIAVDGLMVETDERASNDGFGSIQTRRSAGT